MGEEIEKKGGRAVGLEWIKIRCDLPDDPAVIAMAAELGVSQDEIVGKLVRFWSWVTRHSINGEIKGLNEDWLDRYLGLNKTAASLIKVGWLLKLSDGLALPKYDRHMSQNAKARALANERMARYRAKLEEETQGASQNRRPDEMREDERIREATSVASPGPIRPGGEGGKKGFRLTEEAVEAVAAAWNSLPAPIPKLLRMSAKRLASLRVRMSDEWWRQNYPAAIEKMRDIPAMRGEGTQNAWLASFEWFLQPDTVTKLVEGRYDTWGKSRQQGALNPSFERQPVFSKPENPEPKPTTPTAEETPW